MAGLLTLPVECRRLLEVSYGAWFLTEMWISARDLRPAAGVRIDRGSRLVVAATIYGGVLAAFFAAGLIPPDAPTVGIGPVGGPENPLLAKAAAALGVVLIWSGIGLRLWSVLTLGRFFRTHVVVQDEHQLVQTGPYRWLRNPSYTGALITLAGLGTALGNWFSAALAFAIPLLGFLWRIHVEDAALRSRFGPAYEDYRERTWALVPFLW